MIKNTTLAFLLSLFCVAPIAAQCPAGEIEVIFELDTDQYWYESNWLIKDVLTGQVLVADVAVDSTYHSYTYCLPDNGCKQFEMRDDYGDGMTPDGWFRVTVNGTVVRTMNNPTYIFKKDSFEFGCAPGSKCTDAIPIDTGSWVTPDFSRIWYSFIPADTGVYTINACDTLNTCKTRLWVYSTCANIFISNDQTGALFYAADSCNGGVNTSLYLAGGREYIFRIEPDLNSCPEAEPIHFELSFNGPIIGCTDPAACNYNPLATIPSACIPQGDPDCPSAPDLVTDENLFRNSLILNVTDNTQPCDVKERCLRGLGNRFVLDFNTKIKNIGDADYYIGRKPTDTTSTTSTQFVYDACHNHWHYIGYAEYILFNSAGYRLPIGTKAGFCVFDLECPTWQPRKFNCEVMGLTAGCADVYQIGLPCQSVDITDIPPDDYTLVIRVNWDRSRDSVGRLEKTYDNNWAQACFNLSYSGSNPDVEFHNDQCPPFVDCAGVQYGDAQPDCNGVCNGVALHGDINQDTLRDAADIEQYLTAAVADNGDASTCFDLNDDGVINVYDAALLQECTEHGDDESFWVKRFACQFPGGFDNTQDLVSIIPASVDTVAKTFDLEMVNPYKRIMGYEFSLSGLVIDSVEHLTAGYNGALRFNAATGEILSLGLDESAIEKSPLPSKFLRVHYSALTGLEVCLTKISAVVNDQYETSNATIGVPSCLTVKTSSTHQAGYGAFGVFVQPNPFHESTTIFFENPSAEPVTFILRDLMGNTVRTFEGIRDQSLSVSRGNLPAGTYVFTLSGANGSANGKIMVH